MARRVAAPLALASLLVACGGEPPESLAGFRLGMTQGEVTRAAGEIGGFTCRFRGTRPPVMVCAGETAEGPVRIVAVEDATRSITLTLDPSGRDPQRTLRRFVRGFGDPAWRERPVNAPAGRGQDRGEAYHTFWVNDDSTRAIAAVCAGAGLLPPCDLELTATSPAGVVAKLDSLLGIPPADRRRR